MVRRTLAGAWLQFRSNFITILAIVVTFWLPIYLIGNYVSEFVYSEDDEQSSIRLYRYLENFIGIIADGAIVTLGICVALRRSPRADDSIHIGFVSWPKFVITRLIYWLAICGGFLCLILPGFYMLVRLSLIDQVVINERFSAFKAIRRSHELTRNRFWHLAAINSIYVLIIVCWYLSIYMVFEMLPLPDEWLWVIDACIATIARLALAYWILCLTVVYTDIVGVSGLNAQLFGPIRKDRSIFDEN